ncbi:hypothetical protein B6U70_01135 [Euryarchaeota archaeon ex4484_162]|nr:MAG: hypothetical protein FE038_02170 [Thermoplasmata archaeon]MCD6108364.1 hypothetical protein [Thermoplasmata archaeon]OYT58158.1 MAG: hypothetical protein B6U70_01135 [Euryarchaeota archaeon ex4484_162]RLF31094.1 MAG: hypothetical protein DRJ99_00535 [Thermoplasmata archaeon]RLF62118.1 MAG: hypothetical protein DRN16_02450 [Thermoplasmata archaeon]
MACFLVPGAEAVVTTVIQKAVGKEKAEKWKLRWLNTMLWGGVILLAIEHIWHGEVVPWPPFLTAMSNPADIAPMLHEMATVGTAMAITITITWGILVALATILPEKIALKKRKTSGA